MRTGAPDLDPAHQRQSSDPFAAVLCPALRRAVQEVSAVWAPEWAPRTEGESSINRLLIRLAVRLDLGSDVGVEYEDGEPEMPEPADVLLLAAIRRSLLEQWRRKEVAVDHDRVLGLLHSIDLLAEKPVVGASDPQLAESDAFRLVAEVAHDLRSPLTSILFLSEALRNGQSGSLTELQERQLGLIYSAALGLAGVSNDLMTIAQEQTSLQFDEAVPFSLHETFQAVREMVAPAGETKRIRLHFDVRCSGHRHGHPGPLGRVLLNLTTNAIGFTPEGGSVEVLAEPVAWDMVEVSVRDTGQGITPEKMAQLYQPFQKSQGRPGFFFAASVASLIECRIEPSELDPCVGCGELPIDACALVVSE